MSRSDISRHVLDDIATNLRAMAAAARDSAALHDTEGNADDAEHWAGRAEGLMDAHGIVVAALTAGQSDGHRCPETNPAIAAVEGGAR